LLRAFGGADKDRPLSRQVPVQPACDQLRLLFAARGQTPLLIGGGAVSFFGFGVTPEYQFHSSLLSGNVKAKSSV
jgi:hypothetical protein